MCGSRIIVCCINEVGMHYEQWIQSIPVAVRLFHGFVGWFWVSFAFAEAASNAFSFILQWGDFLERPIKAWVAQCKHAFVFLAVTGGASPHSWFGPVAKLLMALILRKAIIATSTLADGKRMVVQELTGIIRGVHAHLEL